MLNNAAEASALERTAEVRALPVTRNAVRFEAAPSQVTDPRLISSANRATGPYKRAFDVAVAGGALVFLAPALLAVAALVWAQDRGHPLYGHERVGRHGRRFRCWKFRSMAKDGDALLRAHLEANPSAAEEWESTRKLKKDPRVTFLGAILRKTRIDELPQLWNVLRGDMSLVGPRPITRCELDRYGKDRRYYLLVRPGITGLWQVSGRSDTSYEQRVKLDRTYLEHFSHSRDLLIMLKTIPAVLLSRGAA